MTRLIDVVNFNADASCLDIARWLTALEGGIDSEVYRWLSLYVEFDKPVSLGFTGCTVADIAEWNPDSLDLINAHPDIFEIVLRPFAHDISLLRSDFGFAMNLEVGMQTLEKAFGRFERVYLPPEFMCTAQQIRTLADRGVHGIFIYRARFDDEVEIPDERYVVRGVQDSMLWCLPFEPQQSQSYLESVHDMSADAWNAALCDHRGDLLTWRDGESPFLLPNSVDRERAWLVGENGCDRGRLRDLNLNEPPTPSQSPFHTYPIHSFAAWIREMKMYWFVESVRASEVDLARQDADYQRLWLQVINSDFLSSVEKRSPVIDIKMSADSASTESFVIKRQRKSFVGEEILHLLENRDDAEARAFYETSTLPHMRLLRSRMSFLEDL